MLTNVLGAAKALKSRLIIEQTRRWKHRGHYTRVINSDTIGNRAIVRHSSFYSAPLRYRAL